MTLLSAENVTKNFQQGKNNIHAVREANLGVEKGERIFIHGHSGAGKSTLIQMLGGLNEPSEGFIKFKGEDLYLSGDRKRSRIRNTSFGFMDQHITNPFRDGLD